MVTLILLMQSDLVEEYYNNLANACKTDLSEWEEDEDYAIREFETQAEANAYVKGIDDIADGILNYAFASRNEITGIEI